MSRQKREVFEELIDEVAARRTPPTASTRRSPTRWASTAPTCAAWTCWTGGAGDRRAPGAGDWADERSDDNRARPPRARRVRTPRARRSDRRRVLVELTAKLAQMAAFYSEHAAEAERLYQRYTEAQLEMLLGFVRGGREFNERRAASVERQARERENLHKPV